MSRIAKNSIKIDKETTCNFQNGVFVVKGKLGEMKIEVKDNFTTIQNTTGCLAKHNYNPDLYTIENV